MKKVIIDTDPGIDDAVALALAIWSKQLDIRLISTVAGNVSVDKVTKNLLKLLTFWEQKIPVAIGCDRPLLRKAQHAADIHGLNGMDGYDFPITNFELLQKEHAVNEMYKVLMASKQKVTLVMLGPLTNLALLLRVYPECMNKIEEVVLMGGALGRGNQGILSEFNMAFDPEAAQIVFDSHLPITVAVLEVGDKALVSEFVHERLQTMNQTGHMLTKLLENYRSFENPAGTSMYDSCAIAYLLAPEMFTVQPGYLRVETAGELTSGATLIDLTNRSGQAANCQVCTDLDTTAFQEWFLATLKAAI